MAVLTAPVAVCVSFISAPGTAEPLASCTAPLICAVDPCPQTTTQAEINKHTIRIFILPSLDSLNFKLADYWVLSTTSIRNPNHSRGFTAARSRTVQRLAEMLRMP